MAATIAAMPREKKPPTVTVRLSKGLARKLRIVAAAQEKDASDYLGEIIRPILSREMKLLGRTISEDEDEEDEEDETPKRKPKA